MSRKKKKINGIGFVTFNLMTSDDLDLRLMNQKVKAKITLEITDEPCEVCGKLTASSKLCFKCGKVICDECAKTEGRDRYCPVCFDKVKSLRKLA